MLLKNAIVFDNGGKTFDRYTIIDKKTGNVFGSSSNPFHPQGFGCFCFNIKTDTIEKSTPLYVRNANKEGFLGKKIHYKKLPLQVQNFIQQS